MISQPFITAYFKVPYPFSYGALKTPTKIGMNFMPIKHLILIKVKKYPI
jgi:hypothetical protein